MVAGPLYQLSQIARSLFFFVDLSIYVIEFESEHQIHALVLPVFCCLMVMKFSLNWSFRKDSNVKPEDILMCPWIHYRLLDLWVSNDT